MQTETGGFAEICTIAVKLILTLQLKGKQRTHCSSFLLDLILKAVEFILIEIIIVIYK